MDRTALVQALATLEADGLALVYLFGSRARDSARDDSDLDLALVFRRDFEAREQVIASVARAASVATGIERVDVVDLERQGPIFAHDVLIYGKRLVVFDEERRVDFETDVCARAFDFRPTWRIATAGKLESARAWIAARQEP